MINLPSTPISQPILSFSRSSNNWPCVSLFGCSVANLTLEQTLQEVIKIIKERKTRQHCVVNAGKVVLMKRNKELDSIVRSCHLINADGQSIVWALKLLGRPIPERVTGIDLMERLFVEGDKRGYRYYFLGATQDVIDLLEKYIKTNFPNLKIAGMQHGYFLESENAAIVEKVAASQADVLFIAMGSPKKEYWLAKNLPRLNTPFCMGVGGSFDVVVGKAKRAPRWIQNIGMEWFYRFVQEPKRLWRRYWIDNFVFIYLVLMAFMKKDFRIEQRQTDELMKKEMT